VLVVPPQTHGLSQYLRAPFGVCTPWLKLFKAVTGQISGLHRMILCVIQVFQRHRSKAVNFDRKRTHYQTEYQDRSSNFQLGKIAVVGLFSLRGDYLTPVQLTCGLFISGPFVLLLAYIIWKIFSCPHYMIKDHGWIIKNKVNKIHSEF